MACLRVVVVLCLLRFVQGQQSLGAFPARKTWWAKQLTPGLYTAGQLTVTQIKQAADDGFKSILSHEYIENPSLTESVPSTSEAMEIAQIAGVQYDVISVEDDIIVTLQRLTNQIQELTPPILYFCRYSNTSTFYGLLYLMNQTIENSTFQYKTTADDVIHRGENLGFSFRKPNLIEAIKVLSSGFNINPQNLPEDTWYEKTWWLKPVTKGVFISGQLLRSQIKDLKVKSYLSLRRGVTTLGQPSQEEVTLLNIKDRTGTYTSGGRQTDKRLLATRINANRSNSFISEDSEVNYQRRNNMEFGDHVGFNETEQRQFVRQNTDFDYIHTPIGGEYVYNMTMWEAYKDTWLTVQRPVLFQCRTGYRTTVAAVLTVAYEKNLNSTDALEIAKGMGYPFTGTVASLFTQVLDNRTTETDARSSVSGVMPRSVLLAAAVLVNLSINMLKL